MANATTFSRLMDKAASQKTVLVEIKPGAELIKWISHSADAYYCEFPIREYSDGIVQSVCDDGVPLDVKASIAEVEAAVGSYFHDISTNRIYVHTYDDDAPESHTIIAYWWMYFANETKKPITNNSGLPIYYEPFVVAPPSCTRSVGSPGSPNGSSITVGQLLLYNGGFSMVTGYGIGGYGAGGYGSGGIAIEGPFDNIFYNYVWHNADVRVLLGGEALPYDEYELVGTYKISDIEKNFDVMSISLTDNAVNLEAAIILSAFDTTTYPWLEDSKDGAPIPIGYGQIPNITPTLINTQTLEYQVFSHRCIVLNVYDDGVNVGFTADNSNGKFTLAAQPVGKITCDVIGFYYSAGEKITNNGFETHSGTSDDNTTETFSSWTNVLASSSSYLDSNTTYKVAGTHSLKINHQAHNSLAQYFTGVTQNINLTEGLNYRISAYGKGQKIGVWLMRNYSGVGYPFLRSVGKHRNFPSMDDWVGDSSTSLSLDKACMWWDNSLVSDFQGKSIYFTVPYSGTYTLSVGIFHTNPAEAKTGYVDEVKLLPVEEELDDIILDVFLSRSEVPYGILTVPDPSALAPYAKPLSLYIDKNINVEDVVKLINISTMSTHYVDFEGNIMWKNWELPDGLYYDVAFDRYDIIGAKELTSKDDVVVNTQLGYAQDRDNGNYEYSTYEVLSVKYKYGVLKENTYPTALVAPEAARMMSIAYSGIFSKPLLFVTIRTMLKGLTVDLMDIIEVTMPRLNKGDRKYLRVISISTDFTTNEVVIEAYGEIA